jgi:hypothetical protein
MQNVCCLLLLRQSLRSDVDKICKLPNVCTCCLLDGSADIDSCAAVAVARQAAQLGLPAVVSCLATPSAAAPMQPAVDATLQLLQRVVGCLRHARHSSWPAAANMPRAHFPFPVRCAADTQAVQQAQHQLVSVCTRQGAPGEAADPALLQLMPDVAAAPSMTARIS